MLCEKILLIEDTPIWGRNFEKIVQMLGEKRVFEILGLSEFLEKYKSAYDFDNVLCCFVDLELGGNSDSKISDTYGLDIALPHVRRIAPWVPTVCISRYISQDFFVVSELSVSDFDGIHAKKNICETSDLIKDLKIFNCTKEDLEHSLLNTRMNSEFNTALWQDMLTKMQLRRIAVMTGRSVFSVTNLISKANNDRLVCCTGTTETLKKMGLDLKPFSEGLSLIGFEGNNISIDKIDQGFSGINVSKVGVRGHDEKGQICSYWLMKWGPQIGKLAVEASAHRRMFQRGIERSLQIPQLYTNVIRWNGIGYIVYGYEENAETAFEFILRTKNIDKFAKNFKSIALNLYGKSTVVSVAPKKEIEKWCGIDDATECIPISFLNNTKEVTTALVHGDLHLRNIFIKKNGPALIDFALSDTGPIAIDFAKLLLDIAVFVFPSEINERLFKYEDLKSSIFSGLLTEYNKYLNSKNDHEFFEQAIRAYAFKYLSYVDVERETKVFLKKALVKNMS